MSDVRDLIDRFDRLVTIADGLVPADVLERAARVGRRARDRRGFLGETVVVALAGGTGSGKSSLINALAGEVVTEAGAQRPTTYRPLAWIPANPEPGLVRLLDSIDVTDRVGQDVVPWLAIIDLPDTDSVSEDNRATVERVLPLVDAVVWVVDPEKYQDRLLHERFLRPLARHADRFRFVLNQIDRLSPGEVDALIEDLTLSLRSDGISVPVIRPMAADPPLGQPMGVDGFIADMESLGSAKSVVESGLVSDLDTAAKELMAAAGMGEGSGTGFREQWERVKDEASHSIAGDLIGAGTVAEAGRLGARAARASASVRARRVESVDVAVSPSIGTGTRRAVDQVDRMLGDLIESVGPDHAEPIRDVRATAEREVMGAATTAGVAATIRLSDAPRWWAFAGWIRVVVGLAVGFGVWAIASANDVVSPLSLGLGVLAAIAAVGAIGAVISRSGRSWAEKQVATMDHQVLELVARELDRRIGRPVRDALRIRAGLAAAHAEFELVRSDLRRR